MNYNGTLHMYFILFYGSLLGIIEYDCIVITNNYIFLE